MIKPTSSEDYTTIGSHNFEEIYLSYFPRLLRFAREYVLSEDDAKNIIQDVFMTLWEKRGELKIHINLTSYLFILIKNRCIDHLRRKINMDAGKKHLQDSFELELKMKLYSLECIDQSMISDTHLEKVIHDAIDSLPEKCREVFVRHKIEGNKYKQIAEELHISVNTVENQMSIALRKLREQLKDYLPAFLFLYYL